MGGVLPENTSVRASATVKSFEEKLRLAKSRSDFSCLTEAMSSADSDGNILVFIRNPHFSLG